MYIRISDGISSVLGYLIISGPSGHRVRKVNLTGKPIKGKSKEFFN
jgi:hypothetical protein